MLIDQTYELAVTWINIPVTIEVSLVFLSCFVAKYFHCSSTVKCSGNVVFLNINQKNKSLLPT